MSSRRPRRGGRLVPRVFDCRVVRLRAHASDRADEVGGAKRLFDHDEVPRGSDRDVLCTEGRGQPDLVGAPAMGAPTRVGRDHHAPHRR